MHHGNEMLQQPTQLSEEISAKAWLDALTSQPRPEREAVRVSVTTDDAPGGDDCADGVRVELAEPLGERELIDQTTGEAVEVRQTPKRLGESN
jgi:hypothetical protein